MPKEDYLLKYIEKLGRVIAAMLGLKESGKNQEVLKMADDILEEGLNTDIIQFQKMTLSEFEVFMKNQNFSVSYLEKLCELFVIITDTLIETELLSEMQDFSKKTLILYQSLGEKDKTFSFERESIIQQLKQISELNN